MDSLLGFVSYIASQVDMLADMHHKNISDADQKLIIGLMQEIYDAAQRHDGCQQFRPASCSIKQSKGDVFARSLCEQSKSICVSAEKISRANAAGIAKNAATPANVASGELAKIVNTVRGAVIGMSAN